MLEVLHCVLQPDKTMSHKQDIEKIKLQEEALVFARFRESDALAIGLSLVRGMESAGKPVLIDISLWDRQVFVHSLKGASADNAEWVRRKNNVVKRFQASSYRVTLEMQEAGKVFEAERGTDPMDYAAAGGAFPIRMKDGPIIGTVTVSGLPMRDDHMVAVDAIAKHLGLDPADFGLD